MSSKTLKISADLSLPLELAARTQCIFAQKGAGKTYAAGVQAEELLGAGAQICVLDPTGVWWGLQSTASGGKGPYEIIVMGGGHGDVPLEPEAGEIIADFLVETGQSVVLDVSQFESQAAQDRFSLALATRLYRLKAHDKANIHIILDEADQFCPLKPQKGQEKMLHAWDLIVRLGRSRGLGLTAISNRPASVHTNIRNNIDLLTCLRVTGINDFKALREWTSIHSTGEQAKAFLESVPSLPDGEAFFWSPSWLGIFQRAKIRKKHTFDSSRTPKPGERAIEPKARRAPDLTKLTEQINATVEQAKANDPKLLKQELVKLRAEVAKLSNVKPPAAPAPKVQTKTVERFVLKDGQLKRAEDLVAKWMGSLAKLSELQTQLKGTGDEIAGAIRKTAAPAPAPIAAVPARVASNPGVHGGGNNSGNKIPRNPAPKRETVDGEEAEGPIDAYQQALLDALAKFEEVGLTDVPTKHMAALAGKSTTSSTFDTKRADLKKRGLIEYGAETTSLTEAGRQIAAMPQRAMTPGDLAEAYKKSILTPYQVELFNPILAAGEEGLTREEVAERSGKSLNSSTFDGAVSDLRKSGAVVITKDKRIRPSDALLEPALAVTK